MSTFAEQVAAALDTTDALEAGTRVHAVVLDEIKALDPGVDAEPTGYFNHSFVPDLIVSWKESGKRQERSIFLRHSLRSSRAAGDLEDLTRADKSALFLSLAPDEPEDDMRAARQAVPISSPSRALVTTVPAIDELSTPATGPDPVLGVVRSSVVRSGKGIFVEDDVEGLVLPRERRIEREDLDRFAEVVDANFTEDAAVRINRVFGIVEQALSEEPESIALLDSGNLTATEIRELVPYLLNLEGVTRSRDFWTSVARLITLEEVERLWGTMSELDLTPLASAASSIWRAARAQLAIRAESIDDEDFDRTPRWTVTGHTLSAEVGNWRIAYAFAPMKLKTHHRGGLPARWADLRPALASYTVTAADLSGVVTQGTYGAVEGTDMKARIDDFIEAADDSFHVPGVTIQTGAGDDTSTIRADFAEMMLQASPAASLSTMTHAALDILGYRYPTDSGDVGELLNGVERVDRTEQPRFNDPGGGDE